MFDTINFIYLFYLVTRKLKDFFDGFRINKMCITLEKDHKLNAQAIAQDCLEMVQGPARITTRRNTAAVDQKVEQHQLMVVIVEEEPNVSAVNEELNSLASTHDYLAIVQRPARIIARRFTTAVDLHVQPTDDVRGVRAAAVMEAHDLFAAQGVQVATVSEEQEQVQSSQDHNPDSPANASGPAEQDLVLDESSESFHDVQISPIQNGPLDLTARSFEETQVAGSLSHSTPVLSNKRYVSRVKQHNESGGPSNSQKENLQSNQACSSAVLQSIP